MPTIGKLQVLLCTIFTVLFNGLIPAGENGVKNNTSCCKHSSTIVETTGNTDSVFVDVPITRLDTLPGKAHPDSIPYGADPTLGRRLLKAPAAVFHLAALPIKWGLIWNREYQLYTRLSDIFLNEEGTAGFYPNFSIGGRTPFAAGITYFNRDLFNSGHSLDFNTFYTNPENFKLGVNYKIPPDDSRKYQVIVNGNLRENDNQDVFLGGNRSSEDDRASYRIEQYTLETEAGYLIRPDLLASVRTGLMHTAVHDISGISENNQRADPSPGLPVSSLQKVTLFNSGIGVTFDQRIGLSENKNNNLISTVTTSYDFKQTKIRVYSGALYDAGIRYNRSLTNSDFEYLNYYGDWQQFFSVPGLPSDRRLAFRARLHKRYPLGSGSVPFYEQSILGDADNLRGYRQDRFRNLGSLLLTLEYRYPIWDTWDAVLFTDQGQVFNTYSQIDFKRFNGSVGTGLRFMTASDFLFRIEIAFSKEGSRSLMEFSMNF